MDKKVLREETMDFSSDDYRSAVFALYRRQHSEFKQLETSYKNWSYNSQIYALAKTDGSGHPVPANIQAFNETLVERKKLAIMMKLLQNQMAMLENFWVNKGYSLEELRSVVKTKELQNIHKPIKSEEQVAETAEEKQEEIQVEVDTTSDRPVNPARKTVGKKLSIHKTLSAPTPERPTRVPTRDEYEESDEQYEEDENSETEDMIDD